MIPARMTFAPMGLVQTAWLFTRGTQSVRIVRVTRPQGPVRLFVHGPGTTSSTYDVPDEIEGVRYQSHLERGLVAEGYQLARFTSAERRTGRDRRTAVRGSERRRDLQLVVSSPA